MCKHTYMYIYMCTHIYIYNTNANIYTITNDGNYHCNFVFKDIKIAVHFDSPQNIYFDKISDFSRK